MDTVAIVLNVIVKKNMISLLKTIIMTSALAAFVYAATLAMQGNLEMEVVKQDVDTLYDYLQGQISSFTEAYF